LIQGQDLTVISNNAGVDGAVWAFFSRRGKSKNDLVLCRENKTIRAAISRRRTRTRIHPQGTLASESGQAGPAFRRFSQRLCRYTRCRGKELREFDGAPMSWNATCRRCLIVHAYKAIPKQSRLSQNGAQLQSDDGGSWQGHSGASRDLVEAGEIDPDAVHTPGIFVHRIVHTPNVAKPIEKRTTRSA